MKRLAIITARGGSKRIPRKNIKDFCGKPIIAYSIEAALAAGVFDEVMVSTDDEEIAEIARKYGAKVPFYRSEATANDFATTNDVLQEVLAEYAKRGQEFDAFCCMYPTAPFISGERIKTAMHMLEASEADKVFPVVAFSFPPQRAVVMRDGMLVPTYPEYMYARSQDLEKQYHDAGQFYCFKTKAYKQDNGFWNGHILPLELSELEVQDIDTLTDWEIAEMKWKILHSSMSNIKVVLWDIDGTLLNFAAAEKAAIRKCFEIHGLGQCTDEMLAQYVEINHKYWKMLERGEMSKPEILVGRFAEFFSSQGLDVTKAAAFNEDYQVRLGDTVCFEDNGLEVVLALQGKVRQYAVTNGTRVAQKRKLANSGLDKLLEKAFISDEIGTEKPMVGFFEAVWAEIGAYEKNEVIIIGDSLTSDMQGGANAGILTCWYNPKGLQNTSGVQVDYEIRNLRELLQILKI